MSRKYYREKSTAKERVFYKEIENGIILTQFDPKKGSPYGNEEFQIFVAKADLEENWTQFKFEFESDVVIQAQIKAFLRKAKYELSNHGILEAQCESFEELDGALTWPLISSMVDRDRNGRITDWFKGLTERFDDFEIDVDGAGEVVYYLDSLYAPLMELAIAIKESSNPSAEQP